MLTIHRYFSIEKIKRDMGYRPLVTFEQGWPEVTRSVAARLGMPDGEEESVDSVRRETVKRMTDLDAQSLVQA